LAPDRDGVPRIEPEDLKTLGLATMVVLVGVLVVKKARSRKEIQCTFTPITCHSPYLEKHCPHTLSPIRRLALTLMSLSGRRDKSVARPPGKQRKKRRLGDRECGCAGRWVT